MNIILKLTDNCNNYCSYCYDKINRNRFGSIQPVDVSNLLKCLEGCHNLNLILHGGEPLLYPMDDLKKLFIAVDSMGIPVVKSIHTNGLLLDDKWVEFLMKHDVSCSVSIDKSIHRQHELSTRRLEEIINSGLQVGVLSVIDTHNIGRIIQLYEEFVSIGVRNLAFNPVYETDNLISTENHLIGYREFYTYLYSLENVIERNYLIHMSRYLGIEAVLQCSPDNCRGNWLTIEPNGDIYPCDRVSTKKFYLGNTASHIQLPDIFKLPEYKAYLEATKQLQLENCLYCELASFCRTSCFCNHNLTDTQINTLECNYQANYHTIIKELVGG